jgi:alkylation response protein AidB-like acyl-CoA dehydrogenase
VDFELSADQVALRDGIRSLCEGRFPIKRVRDGFDRAAHAELAEAGVFSLRADGFGVADAAIVFEELGRAVVPGPLVWLYLANGVVDGVAGGLEVAHRRPPWMVEHLDVLDSLLVVDDGGVRSVAAGTIAGAVPVARPLEVVARWRLEGAVVTAAFLAGAAQACTELSVAYAKERRQFDRPIGSFQAVKHLLADMLVRAEVARASVDAAACTLDDPEVGDVARAVAGAKVLAGEAAITNGKTATQVHGGMGFTWEVDVHLYLKRAWVLDTVLGSVDEHADAVAATIEG